MSGKVLVLGDNDLACLSVIRSLARAGLGVHVVSWYESRVARSSRFVERVHSFGDPDQDPAGFSARILDSVAQTKYDMVVPVLDAAMRPLIDVADELNRHSVFAAPDRYGYEVTHDKWKTVQLAEKLGVDVPHTRLVASQADIERLEVFESFPRILKPAHFGTVRKARTVDELRERLAGMVERSSVLVQQFCPGRGVGVEVLCDRGEIVAAFQHERVHEPPEGGASSYRKSVPLAAPLLAVARTMVEAMTFTGPAMFEFKYDERTGRCPLMEINGRLWGSLALSIYAGVDFPKLMHDVLVAGRRVSIFTYRTPCFARNTRRDLFWLFANARTPAGHAELLKVSVTKLLQEPLHLLSGRETWDVESVSDPAPGWYNWVEIAREIAGRGLAKLRHRRAVWTTTRIASRTRGRASRDLLRSGMSVLFLCHGDVNRSAFAAQLARMKLTGAEAPRVESAGFIGENGRRPPMTSLDAARRLGVDMTAHQSTVITPEMLSAFDVLFVMDSTQIAYLSAMDPAVLNRTFVLGALDPESRTYRIDDPHGQPQPTYECVFRKIERCIKAWICIRSEEKEPAAIDPAPISAQLDVTEGTRSNCG